MMVWKMNFLFNWVISRFHANLPGCIYHILSHGSLNFLEVQKRDHYLSPTYTLHYRQITQNDNTFVVFDSSNLGH